MTYTAKEKKLIALAMNPSAQKGEIANASTALFNSIRTRRVRYAQMVNEDESKLALLEQLSAAKANEIELNASILFLTKALEKKEMELKDQISSSELSLAMVCDQRDHITWYCKQSKAVAVKLKQLLEDQKSMFPMIVDEKVMVPKRTEAEDGTIGDTWVEILPADPDHEIWSWIASGLT